MRNWSNQKDPFFALEVGERDIQVPDPLGNKPSGMGRPMEIPADRPCMWPHPWGGAWEAWNFEKGRSKITTMVHSAKYGMCVVWPAAQTNCITRQGPGLHRMGRTLAFEAPRRTSTN